MEKIRKFVPLILLLVVVQTIFGDSQLDSQWLTTFVTFFVAILLEAMPFMLIGSLLSGAIEVFVPRELIVNWVPRNRFLAVLQFGLLGIVFPICECGIVPVIRRLLKKGVPLSCGITYLLAAPIVQPIVFAATLIAFNGSLKIAALRVIGGYLVAVSVGMLSVIVLDPRSKEHIAFDMFEGDNTKHDKCECSNNEHTHDHTMVAAVCGCESHERQHGELYSECSCGLDDHTGHKVQNALDCGCGHNHDEVQSTTSRFAKLEHVLKHAAEDFLTTGSYLIFGALIAAAMQTFISQDALAKIGHGPVMGPLVMMAMAFTMSLCSTADSFVAAAFTQFSVSARMAFLVMGPMVDIKLVAMYNGFLSRKATIFVFGSASVLALAYALVMRWMGL